MGQSLRDYLYFAIDTAKEAGQLTLKYFQTGLEPELKADESPVTRADKEAEQLIRRRIEREYTGHDIIGEEYGGLDSARGSHRWIIDPIDGTRAFVRGVPLYAVLIGLEIEGTCQVGVAYFPALNELVAAAIGQGCWWNGKRCYVSPVEQLNDGIVVYTNAASFARYNRSAEWERIKKAAGYTAGWGDAYGYLLVATGRAELMLDPIMNPWDCAPFPPILAEAGGYFGDWQGNAAIYSNEGLATSKALLPEVMSLIQGDKT